MPIPTYQQMLSPILELATKQDIKRRTARDAMIQHFNLTEEEAQQRIPSGGQTYIGNRTGWVMTFLTKAKLIEKVATATYRATPAGHQFLADNPTGFTERDLRQIEGYNEAWQGNDKRVKPDPKVDGADDDSTTPDEQIAAAYTTLRNALAAELQERLREMDWQKFEQLVVDLMQKMGYGGSREGSGWVTKSTGDEGVDGIINEDRLGLDVIYLQAKRYRENNIGRPKIQEFVGALAGKQANKGVFITTSSFAQPARDYAASVQQKVILIDGEELAELMIDYGLGVTVQRAYEVKRVDNDYFDAD